MSNVEPIDPLGAIASFGIPPRPSPKLDRALDATENCLARHGVRRTTMSDIAREMGVSRPTLYKQVSSVEEAVALVASRQLHILLEELLALLADEAGLHTFVEMAVRIVMLARTHPVAERVLTHEPELVGRVITDGQVGGYIDQVTDLVAPILQVAMERGEIRTRDPRLTAELVLRLCASLILAPSAGDPEDLIREALTSMMEPAPTSKRPAKEQ